MTKPAPLFPTVDLIQCTCAFSILLPLSTPFPLDPWVPFISRSRFPLLSIVPRNTYQYSGSIILFQSISPTYKPNSSFNKRSCYCMCVSGCTCYGSRTITFRSLRSRIPGYILPDSYEHPICGYLNIPNITLTQRMLFHAHPGWSTCAFTS